MDNNTTVFNRTLQLFGCNSALSVLPFESIDPIVAVQQLFHSQYVMITYTCSSVNTVTTQHRFRKN